MAFDFDSEASWLLVALWLLVLAGLLALGFWGHLAFGASLHVALGCDFLASGGFWIWYLLASGLCGFSEFGIGGWPGFWLVAFRFVLRVSSGAVRFIESGHGLVRQTYLPITCYRQFLHSYVISSAIPLPLILKSGEGGNL